MDVEKIKINESGNPENLIQSIKFSALNEINEIEKKYEEDKLNIKREGEKNLEVYEKLVESETMKHIEKMKIIKTNSINLEKRKLYLNKLNEFMDDMIEQSISEFSINFKKYHEYILNVIIQGIENYSISNLHVLFSNNDKDLSNEIYLDLKKLFPGMHITFTLQQDLFRGVILEDVNDKMLYNFTIERIVNRQKEFIRKEIDDIIKEYSG
jgi:vacuolar-type H+-ATPase subunit E/Vma4